MSGDQNPNNKISGEQNPNKKMKSQPYLPELVVHQILLTLPTIPAVIISLLSKQWQSILSSLPVVVLDFDEDEGGGDQQVRHRKFINSLKGCLNYFSGEEQKPVNKFRLHMMYSSPGDATVVDECLMFAITRRVKELDISLRRSEHEVGPVGPIGSTGVSLLTLLKAEFITALILDNLRLNRDSEGQVLPQVAFPFLKTMSFTRVHFKCSIMSNLIRNCPSIESLSLDSCSFRCPSRISDDRSVNISSSTLKYLEVKNCRCIGHNNHHCMVYEYGLLKLKAKNLESFTFDSGYEDQHLDELLLFRCWNLKYLSIHSQCLKKVVLIGGFVDGVMKGTLNAPNLHYLNFSGDLSSMSEFDLEAPNLSEARIQIKNLESTFSWSSEYFSNLRDFLAKFGCSKKITLFVGDVEGLIFPENFRKSRVDSSPILPSSVEEVEVFRRSMARDSELMNSLRWMAPSARIELTKMDDE